MNHRLRRSHRSQVVRAGAACLGDVTCGQGAFRRSGQGYEAVAAVGQCQYAVVGGAVQSGRCLQFGGGVESVERDGVR